MKNKIHPRWKNIVLLFLISCSGLVSDGSLGTAEESEGYVSLPPEAMAEPIRVQPPEAFHSVLLDGGVNGGRAPRLEMEFVGLGLSPVEDELSKAQQDPDSGYSQVLRETLAESAKLHPSLVAGENEADVDVTGGAQ